MRYLNSDDNPEDESCNYKFLSSLRVEDSTRNGHDRALEIFAQLASEDIGSDDPTKIEDMINRFAPPCLNRERRTSTRVRRENEVRYGVLCLLLS